MNNELKIFLDELEKLKDKPITSNVTTHDLCKVIDITRKKIKDDNLEILKLKLKLELKKNFKINIIFLLISLILAIVSFYNFYC